MFHYSEISASPIPNFQSNRASTRAAPKPALVGSPYRTRLLEYDNQYQRSTPSHLLISQGRGPRNLLSLRPLWSRRSRPRCNYSQVRRVFNPRRTGERDCGRPNQRSRNGGVGVRARGRETTALWQIVKRKGWKRKRTYENNDKLSWSLNAFANKDFLKNTCYINMKYQVAKVNISFIYYFYYLYYFIY